MPNTMRIRELREAKGLSQSELARIIGVSHVTINHWEAGVKQPLARRLPTLASVLGVDINDLFAGGVADKEGGS